MTHLQTWFQGIDAARLIQWLMFAVAALLSISVHESSHALMALWLGDDTAKRMGRISLNPLRHLDVAGFLMMVLAHFGWARPVPVNMTRFENPKLGMGLTALAGPVSNILLALVCSLLYQCLSRLVFGAGRWIYYLFLFLQICVVLNCGLAVFNLLPVSPLDGSKILAIVLPERAYFTLMRYERYGYFALLALLMLGVLDTPLAFLRDGLMEGITLVTAVLARLLTGAI